MHVNVSSFMCMLISVCMSVCDSSNLCVLEDVYVTSFVLWVWGFYIYYMSLYVIRWFHILG